MSSDSSNTVNRPPTRAEPAFEWLVELPEGSPTHDALPSGITDTLWTNQFNWISSTRGSS